MIGDESQQFRSDELRDEHMISMNEIGHSIFLRRQTRTRERDRRFAENSAAVMICRQFHCDNLFVQGCGLLFEYFCLRSEKSHPGS